MRETDTVRLSGREIQFSSSRMHVMNHNWSVTKQRLHLQSVAEISCHSVLSGDRIRQKERYIYTFTYLYRDRQTDSERDRQTDRHPVREETDRHKQRQRRG